MDVRPCKVYYYTTASGENPVRNFINALSERQKRKIIRSISYIEKYGIIIAIPHVKKLTGTPLWEIRVLGQDNIRVFYASVLVDSVLLVHGFIKKSQETPRKEIEVATSRLNEWLAAKRGIDERHHI